MSNTPIPLYLVTGFLGAGKTTLLNKILKQNLWEKVGVVVNDFGSVNIDKTLIGQHEDIFTAEVSGGQMFCACVSGNFVESMVKLSRIPVDALIVETSGLAKPAPMEEIIHWSQEKSGGAFDYRGMICVIDASSYPVLSKTVNAVSEQIAYSNMFVVNKCDLVEQAQLEALDETLEKLYPGRTIVHTVGGQLDPLLIREFRGNRLIRQESASQFSGWGAQGRPFARLLTLSEPVSSEKVHEFLNAASSSLYRIKGYIATKDRGLLFADCVGDQIELKNTEKNDADTGLMCIAATSESLLKLPALWKEHTETYADIEPI